MKHLHTFDDFLLESFLNEDQEKTIGRIKVKSADELSKMSPEALQELGKKVQDQIYKTSGGLASANLEKSRKKADTIQRGKQYLGLISAALKNQGAGVDDKARKEELKKIDARVKELGNITQKSVSPEEWKKINKEYSELQVKAQNLEKEL